jgi:hypothetical protein
LLQRALRTDITQLHAGIILLSAWNDALCIC